MSSRLEAEVWAYQKHCVFRHTLQFSFPFLITGIQSSIKFLNSCFVVFIVFVSNVGNKWKFSAMLQIQRSLSLLSPSDSESHQAYKTSACVLRALLISKQASLSYLHTGALIQY